MKAKITGFLIFIGFVFVMYHSLPIHGLLQTNDEPHLINISLPSFSLTRPEKELVPGFLIEKESIKTLPIILPSNATHYTKEAANYLAAYIQKIFGAKPEIIQGLPKPLPTKAIWVGYQKGIEPLFPGADLKYYKPEEVVNIANSNHILISGSDKWTPDAMNRPDAFKKEMVTNVQEEYGTCNAVYTFLQDQLNVRWLWPGELGEDIIPYKQLEIAPFYYRHAPQILDRSGILYTISLYVHKRRMDEQVWGKFQRMQLSSKYIKGDHAFFDWWEKHSNKHPEYFALNRKGERKPIKLPNHVKICMSNPVVWDRWMQDVAEQLQANPSQTLFSAAANDGWGQGHCTCDNCRAWDQEGFDPKKPEMADRDLRFVNILAKKLKAKYPDKDYKVMALAYGFTRPAPKEVKPDDNVIIINCSNFLQQGTQATEQAKKQFGDWAQVAHEMTWRPNLGSPLGGAIGFFDIAPHQTADHFKYVAERNCIGLYFDTYWHHWATQGIQYYIMAQLAWDPQQNIDTLLNDYYDRAYSEAAPAMKAYWTLVENTRNEVMEKVTTQNRLILAHTFYDDAWFQQAQNLINAAKKKASGKHLQRIEYADFGLEYCKLIMDTRKLNIAWEKDQKNEDLKKQIDDNFKKAMAMGLEKTMPRYAVSVDRSFRWPKQRFMQGLHYENRVANKSRLESDDME